MQVVDALSSWQRANGGAQQAAAERLGREGGSHEPSGAGSHEPSERSTDAAEELKVLLFSLQQLKAVCTVCRDYMVARATADSPHAQLSARALARDLGSVAYALSSAPPSTAGLSKLRASFEACVHVLLDLGPSARPGCVAHASAATAGHGCAAVLRFWRRSTACELKPPRRQHDVDGAAASAEQDVKGLGLAQLLLCALRCCTTTGTTLGTELIAEAVELLPAALEALSHRHARIFAEGEAPPGETPSGEAPSGEAPPEALRLIEHSAAIAAAALERAPTQMRAQMFIRLVGASCARQPLPRLLSAELFRRALGALPAAAAAAQLCALWRVGCCMLESEIERTGGCDLGEEADSKGRQLDQCGHRTHDPLSPDSNLLPLDRGHLIGEPAEEVDREHGSVQACRLLRMLASTFPHLAPPAQEQLLNLTAPPIRHAAAAAAAPDSCDDRSLAAIWAALILLEALPATPRTGSHYDLGRFRHGLSALLSAVELHPVGGGSTPPPPRFPFALCLSVAARLLSWVEGGRERGGGGRLVLEKRPERLVSLTKAALRKPALAAAATQAVAAMVQGGVGGVSELVRDVILLLDDGALTRSHMWRPVLSLASALLEAPDLPDLADLADLRGAYLTRLLDGSRAAPAARHVGWLTQREVCRLAAAFASSASRPEAAQALLHSERRADSRAPLLRYVERQAALETGGVGAPCSERLVREESIAQKIAQEEIAMRSHTHGRALESMTRSLESLIGASAAGDFDPCEHKGKLLGHSRALDTLLRVSSSSDARA